jgi:hypothetical protein
VKRRPRLVIRNIILAFVITALVLVLVELLKRSF